MVPSQIMLEIAVNTDLVEGYHKTTKLHTTTWCDEEGTCMSFLASNNPKGKRIYIHHNHVSDILIIKAVKGDGRTKFFEEFKKIELDNDDIAEILQHINCLIKEYF